MQKHCRSKYAFILVRVPPDQRKAWLQVVLHEVAVQAEVLLEVRLRALRQGHSETMNFRREKTGARQEVSEGT